MGNCNSAPFLQPGEFVIRRCVNNQPHDIRYPNKDELNKAVRSPFGKFLLDGTTVWTNNTNTVSAGVQIPFKLEDIVSPLAAQNSSTTLPSKMPLGVTPVMEQTQKATHNGDENIISMVIDKPTTLNLTPKCGNTIEKF